MVRNFVAAFTLALILFQSPAASSQPIRKFRERYKVRTGKVLKVRLDVDAGEVQVTKSSRDEDVRVAVYYPEDRYSLDVDFDEPGSRLRIYLDKHGWFDSDDHDSETRVNLELPAAVEIDFEARVKAGEVSMDFGGLSLVDLELTTWAGEVTVEFSEPNRSEMDFLAINTKIGETEIRKLGNARFKEAEINGGIGEMSVDFRGALLPDADVDVDLDIGETRLILPEDVGVKLSISKFLFLSETDLPYGFMKKGRYYYSKDFDAAEQKMYLRVRPGIGELRIER